MKLLFALWFWFSYYARKMFTISLVANAEGENPVIAPNTWVEVKGANLSKAGDSRVWQTSDFAKNQLPTNLDGVSVTVNGKSAYVYYISPTQVNILTPRDAMAGSVAVVVTNDGAISAPYTVQAQVTSPSFFLFNGGPYVAATHVSGGLLARRVCIRARPLRPSVGRQWCCTPMDSARLPSR